ncbi:efflux RND transporter permease subunit [Saccharospirillum salsuginis]|uniref:Membrane protein n=1 Tax=Saccharospirillum salsuginis TaxID=418750 RepID=A0A918K101_9GAMM|nr:MMPL family transporter [Saccharospirillum salsuginis]GGX41936.1 membrane protein [Saccharospirillum salsuginis]
MTQRPVHAFLDRYTAGVMRYPKTVLVLLLVVVAALATQLRTIELDTDLENFIDESTPARQAYNRVKDQYGRNDVVVVGVSAEDVLADATLRRLATLHERIEQDVPWVNRVNSLIDAPYQQGTEDGLLVDDLIPRPVGTLSRAEIESRIASTPTLEGLVINESRTFTTLVIEPYTYDFDPDAQSNDESAFDDAFGDDFTASGAGNSTPSPSEAEFLPVEKTYELINELERTLTEFDDLDPVVAGMPVINQQLEHTMQSEMSSFIRLTIVLIVVVLVLFFRRVSAVVAPMSAVVLAILATFGILALTGRPIQMPLIMVPSFLLAITVGDAVHLLTHFFSHFNRGEAKVSAMQAAIRLTAIPMLLTSLTTAAGLLSLATGDIIPITLLGVFAALGVILAFLLTVSLIPALMAVWPVKPRADRSDTPKGERLMQGIANLAWRFGPVMSLVWLGVVAVAIALLLQLRFSHNPMNWMPADLPIRQATDTIDDRMSGTINMDVIIDTGTENGIKNPDLLQRLDAELTDLQNTTPGGVTIGHVNSILDIIKGTHQALNEGDPAFYAIPDNPRLLAEELLLFENSGADELSRLVDPSYSETRVTLIMPWADVLAYQDFIEITERRLTEALAPEAEITIAGVLPLLSATLDEVVSTTAWSYGIAALAITLMMMVLLRSPGLGAVAMLPNLAPILVVMGLMYVMSIPLDLFTMLVATIAIGITVDNTVHFTHHFREAFAEHGDARAAIDTAFHHAGRALLTTSIVLTTGFYVFLFSQVHSIFNFGFLSGTAFLLAMVSNFTLTPVLLRWYSPLLSQPKEQLS